MNISFKERFYLNYLIFILEMIVSKQISILRLSNVLWDYKFSDSAKLTKLNKDKSKTFVGKTATVSGWGIFKDCK